LAATCLVAGVVLVYWHSLGAPFLFDDTGAVLQNPTIRHLASLATLNPPADGSTTTNRPIVNLSYAINYAISGEAVWCFHALNLAIHVAAALTLMGIVRRIIGGFACLPDRAALGAASTPNRIGRLHCAAHGIALRTSLAADALRFHSRDRIGKVGR
jgi:hypothetical protein